MIKGEASRRELRQAAAPSRPIGYGPLSSVFLSPDFLISAPTAVASGLLVALSRSIAGQATTVMLAIAGLSAALVGIVVAALTITVGLISPEYMMVLEQTNGGIPAVSRPYRLVVWVCAIGTIVALLSALVWTIIPPGSYWLWRLARGVLFGLSVGVGAYGLVGVAQLSMQAVWHMEKRAQVYQLIREAKARKVDSRRTA